MKFREWLKKKTTITLLIIFFAALAIWQVVSITTGQSPPASVPAPGGLVVTGTAQLADTVRAVGGNRVQIANFVPAGTCPGQADVKPADIENLKKARLFLVHDFQQAQADVKALVTTAAGKDLVTRTISPKGGMMTPAYQTEMAGLVEAALIENDPAGASLYKANADKRKADVAAKADEIKTRFKTAGANDLKVITMLHHADFLRWAGFEVVATYGAPETITPAILADLITKGRAAGVKLVVDNLQSGPDSGKPVARDLNIPQVTITNFPGALPNTDTWFLAVDEDARLIISALGGK
jgi:zinc transport system substrate-binding protein